MMKNDKATFDNWKKQNTESTANESAPVADVPADVKELCECNKQRSGNPKQGGSGKYTSIVKRDLTVAEQVVQAHIKEQFAYAQAGPNAGKPAALLGNLRIILEQDDIFNIDGSGKFSSLRWNELTESAEISRFDRDAKATKYVPIDAAWSVSALEYFEKYYYFNVQSFKKIFDDALVAVAYSNNRIHPIRDALRGLKWDGTPRISSFLTKWAGADDSPYVREVSRLMFATGIHRAFVPGCPIEGVFVFVSHKQGCGKSTLVKWLSLTPNLSLYASQKSIANNDSCIVLRGKWVIEFEEMHALLEKGVSLEQVKAYVTMQEDRFRAPYDKTAKDNPRSCWFIGTTNNSEFLSDPTGNRRFFPIAFKQTADYLFSHADECRHDIEQCWAEAKALYDAGKLSNIFDPSLKEYAANEQKAFTIEDEWQSFVDEYLADAADGFKNGIAEAVYVDGKPAVCVRKIYIWMQQRFPDEHWKQYSQKDGIHIGQLIEKAAGWYRSEQRPRFTIAGSKVQQRCFCYEGK